MINLKKILVLLVGVSFFALTDLSAGGKGKKKTKKVTVKEKSDRRCERCGSYKKSCKKEGND